MVVPMRGGETSAPRAAGADLLAMVEQLYLEHGDFVWRSAARMGVASAEREDVVQDVFMVVHRRFPTFEGRSSITSWLYGIVRGVVWNRNRRVQRRGRLLRLLEPPPAVADPISDADMADAFERGLTRLSPEQREIFALAEVEGLSGREIADALELNVNTVFTRLRAARRSFRTFIEQQGGSEGGWAR
jgi:RNA polymerase sigma-70 factor (ECF subfamily)